MTEFKKKKKKVIKGCAVALLVKEEVPCIFWWGWVVKERNVSTLHFVRLC